MAPDIGENKRKYMNKQINDGYTDGPKLRGQRVKDFLPKPEEIILKKLTTKITITLDSASVDFFKQEAKRLNTSYQRMIRNLLDTYTQQMKSKKHSSSA
ncbi:MAG: CopG family transcriptional regulator [bacterium]|nr:CopG family transcriptional regulator [bacterium]